MSKPLQLIYLFLLINFLILILLNNQDYLTVHNNQLAITSSQVNADKFKKLKKIKKKLFKKLKKKKMVVVPVPIKGTVKVHHYHHMPQPSWGGWGGGGGGGGWGHNPWGGKISSMIDMFSHIF